MRLRLTDEAKADLSDIRDYLEPRSVQGFTRVTSAIFTTMKQLESFPFLGGTPIADPPIYRTNLSQLVDHFQGATPHHDADPEDSGTMYH